MRLLVSIGFLTLSMFGRAQQANNFISLKSKGDIPTDFTTLSTDKYKTDAAENKDGNLDNDFFLSTRFFMDELLLSGTVLFNDPVTTYLNKVAKYVLRGETDLLKELRFYVLKSNTPNAFSTDQGIILFTTGLMAQLENEAQLAYIICHEVSHYTEKHVRNEYVENQNIKKGRGEYRQLSYNERISKMSVYSKEKELDADQKGIDIYLKSEYSVEEIFSGFEVLLYSYLPFEDIKFDSTFFNTEHLIIPGTLFPDTVNEITQEIDYNDEGHTHPNIEKRIDAAFDYLGDDKAKGDKKYVISEEEFLLIRDLARFENINIYLAQREYGHALYSIYLLKRKFPNNRFLDLALVKAFYGLTKYKNSARYNEVTEKVTKVEGESYVLHCFLKNVSKEQLNVISFRHAYDMMNKYPGDKIFKDYSDDLKRELALKSKIDPDDFKDISYESHLQVKTDTVKVFDIADSIRKVEVSDLSKYEKIRLKKELKALETVGTISTSDKEFYLYSLHDIVKNGDLKKELKAIQREQELKEEAEDLERENVKYSIFKKSQHLGIDKVVVVDPLYENYKLNENRNHLKSEDKKLGLTDIYTQDYKKLDLETDLVDSKNLLKSDVDEYNDLGLLMQWLSEVVAHDEIDMIASNRDQMNDLSNKYGTSHFLFSGIFAYKERSQMKNAHWYGIMLVYPIPLVVIDLLIVHNYFEIVALSVDASTDQIEFMQSTEVNLKSIDGIMKAYVYDVLYQLSSEPKTKK